jgi:hypothetical protein
MKIVVLNHTDVRVELLNVVDSLCPDEIEEFLYDRGFDVSNISWMEVPSDIHDYVPIKFHEFDVKDNDEETHSVRTARLKNFTIYDSVQDIKCREQEELADVLRHFGTRVDDGYEYHFEGECPIIAGYDYDEPCDVVILSVRVDDDGYISLVGDEKNDRGNPHSLDVDEIFAGHLEYVTSYILQ